MYRFDSDYLEGCLPQILEALATTNYEQTPGYGEDGHCQHARMLIAQACGADVDVHFLVGGTQTNATVISSILRPFQGVICAESGHINVHETGAIEHQGHKVLSLPSRDGKLKTEDIRAAFEFHRDDFSRIHTVKPGMVYISLPTETGTLYTRAELEDIYSECRRWNAPLFIDGARLGYGLACPECDLSLHDLPSLCDVFYIGGTKQGALFGEAVVFCNKALAEDFRYQMKQNGAMIAKGRLLGIQFETLFTDNLYFKAAENAIRQADIIRKCLEEKGIGFFSDSPTNLIFPILRNGDIARLEKQCGFELWAKVDEASTAIRITTSWATTDEAVRQLCEAIRNL